jgi:hypothetical protein
MDLLGLDKIGLEIHIKNQEKYSIWHYKEDYESQVKF